VDGAQSGDHFFFHCASSSPASFRDDCIVDNVVKMQGIHFKLRTKIIARKTEWMNVSYLLSTPSHVLTLFVGIIPSDGEAYLIRDNVSPLFQDVNCI
jgi:hypothetical protein